MSHTKKNHNNQNTLRGSCSPGRPATGDQENRCTSWRAGSSEPEQGENAITPNEPPPPAWPPRQVPTPVGAPTSDQQHHGAEQREGEQAPRQLQRASSRDGVAKSFHTPKCVSRLASSTEPRIEGPDDRHQDRETTTNRRRPPPITKKRDECPSRSVHARERGRGQSARVQPISSRHE